MFISKAYAQASDAIDAAITSLPTPGGFENAVPPEAPGVWEAFAWNMGLIAVLVLLFYMLLIAPQQKRFKAHSEMLQGLQKGDKVITGGGLVGKVDKILDDKEVVVDLGGGMKVTALRSTIQSKNDQGSAKLEPKDDSKGKVEKTPSKKESKKNKKAA